MSNGKYRSAAKSRSAVIHSLHKRIHALKSALTAVSYMVELVGEEPAFFATDDGAEYLDAIKNIHLRALQAEIDHLRDELPPDA